MNWIRSFINAWHGIIYCYHTQMNFRIHMVAAMLVTIAAFMFGITNTEWILIIGCFVSVLVTEMLNTAIEKLCDLVTLEFHPLIKIIKDVSAGMVLVSAIGSVVTGIIIFFPKIFFQLKTLLQ